MALAPKRRWFQFGEPWGLLDRSNPTATPASTARHALGWAIVGAVGYLVLSYFRGWSLSYWPAKLLICALLFGFVGGLMEWQIDDDEPPPKSTNG